MKLGKSWISIFGVIAVCFGLQTIATGVLDDYQQRLVALAGLYVTLAVSLNFINGITGQFSIGHAAFYQIGAYTAGYLTFNYASGQPFGLMGWMILMGAFGAVMAGLAGLLVGLPSLRLKGDYLAIITLGFGEIVRILVQNMDSLGGSYGMNVYPAGFPKTQQIAIIWLLAFTCIGVIRNILKTIHGLSFLSVRDDEIASRAMGVNVTKVKVVAFLIGSAFAGAAGGFLALYEGFITPGTFAMDLSFILLTMVMLGGSGSITGAALAAVALFYIPEWLRGQPDITGSSLVAAIITILGVVTVCLRLVKNTHTTFRTRAISIASVIVLAVFVKLGLTAFLSNISKLHEQTYEGNQLRMVIFAGTLIIVMLFRPQGMLGHFEFSWEWVSSIFRKKQNVKAVNS
jgi:branched-chain amino acid transport system permease protein